MHIRRRKEPAEFEEALNEDRAAAGEPILARLRSMTVQNIKREIEMLSPAEVSELHAWLNRQQRDEEAVDAELKDAVDAGRFDKLIDEAIADEKAGLTTPL